ncbi:phosphoribosylanthranilate isomerase [Bacillus nakamurai]|uniref:N-(5'-phosphoribosyl)anthranilate isomerase n=1 Tax=Bacillus nakamurai TaxID=1793963 RepID=A0A150F8W2_9BACI|nr:phosphoribosylanthranilate isomerase [Bacillus nakamurai]KXZ21592.1 N-(5'-phosphoribosyl)anthranilate isomerase [Bacillus nakamurai]MED1229248.1 phosphoribosylanthranilate isomerase [Bacillus nakamurai]
MEKPELKYCGIRSERDYELAALSQADYLGFIFAESKRKVTPGDVQEWFGRFQTDQKRVGVFVNETAENIARIAADLSLDVIQLHGDESPEDARRLRPLVCCEIWKALHHRGGTLQQMTQFESAVDGYVIDSFVKGMRGGTGITFSWDCVPLYRNQARHAKKRCFIAGGVNPETITDLLKWRPGGIDLASGIEKKGQKDKTLIRLLEERMNHYVSIPK